VDLTAYVRSAKADGKTRVSVALRADYTEAVLPWFDSSEAANAPRLVVSA